MSFACSIRKIASMVRLMSAAVTAAGQITFAAGARAGTAYPAAPPMTIQETPNLSAT